MRFSRFFLFAFFMLSSIHVHALPIVEGGNVDAQMYKVVVERVVSHERPTRYALWDKTISGDIMLLQRVPRQLPETQFTRGLKGLPQALQTKMFTVASKALQTNELDVRLKGSKYTDYVDSASLVRQTSRFSPENWLMVIGLSAAVFDEKRKNALIYVEHCSAAKNAICSGEGFWFTRRGKSWSLKSHAFLWQGDDRPFWVQSG
jgi:hypothetical protein